MAALDLLACVQQTLHALREQAQHAQVELIAELPDEPPVWINGDRVRLGQVLRNLILNAVQAMSRSGGILHLVMSQQAGEAGKALIRLVFTDTGPGFSPEALAHAQDLFFSEREGGMGVGLSVVAEIIAAHGGTLHLANTEPHGARVSLTFPQAASPTR